MVEDYDYEACKDHFHQLHLNSADTATRNYYSWGQQKALEGDLEAATQAYQRAYEAVPDDADYEWVAQATVVTLTISGDVMNLAGEIVVGAQVRILDQAVGETDSVGHFETEIEWLSVGELLVEIESADEGFDRLYLSIVSGKTDYAITATVRSLLRILAWTAYTDMDEEYAHVLDALSRLAPMEYDLAETDTTDASTLESALRDQDVFLISEQELANTETLTEIGSRFGTVLGEFVRQGGRVISLGEWENHGGFLKAMELLDASTITGIDTGAVSLVNSDSPIAQGLPVRFDAENATFSYRIADADATVVAESADGNAVVATRSIGLGQVIIIGYDYYVSNSEADRLLVNAIFWPR